MQKIIPHLWFDTQAREAAEWYVSLFKGSSIKNVRTLTGTPSGDCDVVSFSLSGLEMMSISAGPYFTCNPSISFFVNFDPSEDDNAKDTLTALWKAMSEDGKVLMPLQEYPFSKWYGWVEDKYGISWQLILTNPDGEKRPHIVPSLLFTQSVAGKAEEATDYYISLFNESKRGLLARYPSGMGLDKEGTVMFTDFSLSGQWFAAMDSAQAHAFTFNEGISLIINCDNQEEIDYFWEKLSAVPEAEQCGWCKDKYGISWQIVPHRMNEMMEHGTKEQIENVTKAFLQMKKFTIAELEKAYNI